MPQALIYLDEIENEKIKNYSKKWKLSKADTMKKVIRDFEEGEE